ncbi:MAG: glycosyltransferase family 39 protein [Phycisphaerales bacterium]|nr:MAG: glycosyltransferase family 39 protein [Phycisphaerales bacterium]
MGSSVNGHLGTSTGRAITILTFIWVLAVLLIKPEGDFPLNDDWAYGLPAMLLAQEGTLQYTDWQSMPLLTQVVWGAMFCLAFGSSFTVLRVSTLVAGWASIIATYALARRFTLSNTVAMFAALTLAANPIFLGMSHTFMTDVHFLAPSLLSVLSLVRGLERNRQRYIVLGMVLACWATLTRQLGLAIPISFAIAWLVKSGFRRQWWWEAALPLVLIAGTLIGYTRIIEATIGLPAAYHVKAQSMLQALNDLLHLRFGMLRYPGHATLIVLMYLGLFAAPFLLLRAPALFGSMKTRSRRVAWICVGSLALPTALTCIALRRLMPLTGNILADFGMGWRSLPGATPHAPYVVWLLVTLLAACAGATLMVALVASLWKIVACGRQEGGMQAWHLVFLWSLSILVVAPPSCMYGPFFDRYVLFPVPLAMILLLGAPHGETRRQPRWAIVVAAALLLLCFCFSLGATHDYLDWNRARWRACTYLTEELRADPESVDGGFEYNNYYHDAANIRQGDTGELINRENADYRISFTPLEDYEIIKRLDCDPWLPWSIRQVCILRNAGDQHPEGPAER